MGYFSVEKKQSSSTQINVGSSMKIKLLINRVGKTVRNLPIGTLYVGFGAVMAATFSIISIFNGIAAQFILETMTSTACITSMGIILSKLLFRIPYVANLIFFAAFQENGMRTIEADSKLNALVQTVAKNSGLKTPISKVYLIKSYEKNAMAMSIGKYSAVSITQVSFLLLPLLLRKYQIKSYRNRCIHRVL